MHKWIGSSLTWIVPLALTLGSSMAHAQRFEISSTSYQDGDIISKRQAGTSVECGSGNALTPQVSWHNAPANTASIAILMHDPDGQKGLGVSHWVAYNIDARRGSIGEGDGQRSLPGITVGKNVSGEQAYRGLCPPASDHPHHYTLTVIATTLAPGVLPPSLNRDELLAKLQGKTLAAQSIVGRYGQ
ncbi:YbhB/YbcL family Raf kinase inhibitor-like protein [Pseudomonas sp. NPDC090592]|uniref:YbhB/YbcL family Raf kinase inhibitor-like protein n=1 Tax=Pseudomonas sp. NPDC090592 TaxID=3364480 RepID=UPI00383AD0FC